MKVRLAQYARKVDQALRDLLGGRETPLILAAAEPLSVDLPRDSVLSSPRDNRAHDQSRSAERCRAGGGRPWHP